MKAVVYRAPFSIAAEDVRTRSCNTPKVAS